MVSVVARGRSVLATIGSVTLGVGLAVTLAPSSATALASADDRPDPVVAPAGPQAKALADALPARLGTLYYTSVYGSTPVKSSTGRRLTVALSASKVKGETPSFYVSLSRGQKEQHAWGFEAPNSSFDISNKAAGKVALSPKKTARMGKIALKVKPDGRMKSDKCGGEVYAKSRNVVISGTFFFDTGSKWGKVGSKTKPFKFRTTHRVYFSYAGVTCPPTEYPDTCYNSLSWSAYRNTAKSSTYMSASKQGTKSSIYASRSTELAKPAGAWRSDSAWGTGDAPVLTVAPDDSASMKIHGVRGSGTLADPNAGWTYEDPCDEGTQHFMSWSGGTVTNGATPIKVPAQVFGSFTLPNGTAGYMSRSWFN